MQKIYLLLRNNKQSGPYTLDELLQLSLKPFDLVWVQGKSAGWSYPSEIDALKSYVAETPKTIEKKAEPVTTPQATPSPINEPGGFANGTTKVTAPKSAAKNIYISFPGGTQPEKVFTSSIPSAILEESPEAKLERKALELRNKIQAFAENKNQPKADNELDTKYTKSLEDIKEEYSSWMHRQQKKKTFISKKSALITAGIAALIIGGYLILPIFSSKKIITEEPILSAQEIKASAPAIVLNEKEKKVEKKKTHIKSAQKTKANTLPTSTSKTFSTNSDDLDKVDSYLDSLKSVEKTIQQPKEETVYEPAITPENGSRQSTKRNADVADSKPSSGREGKEDVPFSELIKLSESIGSGTPHLSLYNNSNKHINFVAIDVSYYKANKKLLQKKTLYFKDIAPKNSVKLFVPQEKNAASVDYQMGLISTDNGLYYAKQ